MWANLHAGDQLSYSLIGIREMTSGTMLDSNSLLTNSFFFLNIGAWGDILFDKKIPIKNKRQEKNTHTLQHQIHSAKVTQQWTGKHFAECHMLIDWATLNGQVPLRK